MQNMSLTVNGVAKTYTQIQPLGKDVPAVWVLKGVNSGLETRRIEISMSRNSNGVRRVGLKVTIPDCVTANAQTTLVGKAIYDGKFIVPDAIQTSIGLELRYTVAAVMANTIFISAVDSELAPY